MMPTTSPLFDLEGDIFQRPKIVRPPVFARQALVLSPVRRDAGRFLQPAQRRGGKVMDHMPQAVGIAVVPQNVFLGEIFDADDGVRHGLNNVRKRAFGFAKIMNADNNSATVRIDRQGKPRPVKTARRSPG